MFGKDFTLHAWGIALSSLHLFSPQNVMSWFKDEEFTDLQTKKITMWELYNKKVHPGVSECSLYSSRVHQEEMWLAYRGPSLTCFQKHKTLAMQEEKKELKGVVSTCCDPLSSCLCHMHQWKKKWKSKTRTRNKQFEVFPTMTRKESVVGWFKRSDCVVA